MIHNFRKKLEEANSKKLNPFWEQVYHEFFGDIYEITGTIENLLLQKKGIDRVVTLANGKSYWIDEKVRNSAWPDILLEYKSAAEYDTPGWMNKDLTIDYLAYAFIPTKTCYLFDWVSLKRAWRYCGDDWIKKYKTISAKNEGYTTLSVAVPTVVLLNTVKGAKKVICKI